ncbi:helix-turn-helix domain-containing protein [Chryseolinea lacunae]|uniref:Helix-turn-helix transcriptional regulator n=1 Tax=Chryseolinea lacunae TaxID=2801331 RepID=A0ABS1KMZ7_9BACT|nr:helix-turn-helix transcriptional regulator [Chryseolinea lacunae]MBL0740829.1 helix-turn-helix transcriptional regulator [Chryseolinea lacunae]
MTVNAKRRNVKKLIAFGTNLQRIRLEKGLSQEDLAHLANVAYTTINRLENGRLNTGVSTIFDLARALKVSPKELFEF